MHSMSQIDVPGPNGPIHITSQQDVEQHISEALALCFQLTSSLPTPHSWLTPTITSLASLVPLWLPRLSYKAPTNVQQE